MRYVRAFSLVAAVAILAPLLAVLSPATTAPPASATVDPSLCSGDSSRIAVSIPFFLDSSADLKPGDDFGFGSRTGRLLFLRRSE